MPGWPGKRTSIEVGSKSPPRLNDNSSIVCLAVGSSVFRPVRTSIIVCISWCFGDIVENVFFSEEAQILHRVLTKS